MVIRAISCHPSPLLLLLIGAAVANPIERQYPREAGVEANKTKDARGFPLGFQNVCYGDLGCFSTAPPWNFMRLAYLPDKPEVVNTQFHLFTRRNTNPIKLVAGDVDGLLSSPFDGSKPTKFIIHGFLIDWGTSPWLKEMAEEFLIQDDANVFCVDWHGGSRTLYGQACANSRVVGAEIAKMVKFLSNQTGLRHDDVHIIGHSLGAHIAGYAGTELKDLGRITGMDPAGPFFTYTHPLVRLDETDAKFVEVLHTDVGTILQTLNIIKMGGFGTTQPSGHVDVYVSGGIKQPGCSDSGPIDGIISDGLIEGIESAVVCNHYRAPLYMTESIRSSCPWRSYKCADWKEFQTGRCLHCPSDGLSKTCNGVGNRAVKPSDGSANNIYWMSTASSSPFCRYHYHVQLTLSEMSNKEQKGKLWFKLVGDKGSTDFQLVNEDGHILLKPGSTYDFLVTSANDLGPEVKLVEIKWENDASWFDIMPWQREKPTIYLGKVTAFSGEHQTEHSFCDISSEPLKSTYSRAIYNKC